MEELKEDPEAYKIHNEVEFEIKYDFIICILLFIIGVLIGYYVIP